MTPGPKVPLSHWQIPQVGQALSDSISGAESPCATGKEAGYYKLLKRDRNVGTSESGYGQKSSTSKSLSFLVSSTDEVSLSKMRVALMNIDPSLDKQTLCTYLSQAFQLPVAELPLEDEEKQEEIVVKLETALEQLRIADTKRVGLREPEPAS